MTLEHKASRLASESSDFMCVIAVALASLLVFFALSAYDSDNCRRADDMRTRARAPARWLARARVTPRRRRRRPLVRSQNRILFFLQSGFSPPPSNSHADKHIQDAFMLD